MKPNSQRISGWPNVVPVVGITVPFLDHPKNLQRFFKTCEQVACAQNRHSIQVCIRLGRLTALQKPNKGVREIVSSDIVRRLVARTMSQQLNAMSTKSGCECIAHVLQGLTELVPRAVMSIDSISAHDLISPEQRCKHWTTWQEGAQQCHLCRCSVEHLPITCARIPWAECTQSPKAKVGNKETQGCRCCSPWVSTQRWRVQRSLREGEVLFAFLDDVYTDQVLGTPFGHQDFVRAIWRCSVHIITHCWPAFPWSRMCSRRGCFWLTVHPLGRTMWPELVVLQMAAAFCQRHDTGVSLCLCRILHVSPE